MATSPSGECIHSRNTPQTGGRPRRPRNSLSHGQIARSETPSMSRHCSRRSQTGPRCTGSTGSLGPSKSLRKSIGERWTLTSGMPCDSWATRAPKARLDPQMSVCPGVWWSRMLRYTGSSSGRIARSMIARGPCSGCQIRGLRIISRKSLSGSGSTNSRPACSTRLRKYPAVMTVTR